MNKKVFQKTNEARPASVVDLYSMHDPLPVPEAYESNSDAAWALWEEVTSKLVNELQENRPNLSAASLTKQTH